MKKPNDRPVVAKHSSNSPRIYRVVRGESFPRPGLESYFVDHSASKSGKAPEVTGIYCSCNKVSQCSCVPACTCQSVCSCAGHSRCSCVSHSSRTYRSGCRCAPVH